MTVGGHGKKRERTAAQLEAARKRAAEIAAAARARAS